MFLLTDCVLHTQPRWYNVYIILARQLGIYKVATNNRETWLIDFYALPVKPATGTPYYVTISGAHCTHTHQLGTLADTVVMNLYNLLYCWDKLLWNWCEHSCRNTRNSDTMPGMLCALRVFILKRMKRSNERIQQYHHTTQPRWPSLTLNIYISLFGVYFPNSILRRLDCMKDETLYHSITDL